jgi:hypothetical protein
MIAATILAIFLLMGGGSMFGELMSDYIEDPIEATIVEEERREMALDAHDDLEDAISEFNKQVLDDRDKLNELVENYESTPHEFDQLFVDAFARRRQEVEAIWKQRSAMLLHIKADEWETIIISAKAEAAEDKK